MDDRKEHDYCTARTALRRDDNASHGASVDWKACRRTSPKC